MARLNIFKLHAVAPVPTAPAATAAIPATLCHTCALAHVASGHDAGEEKILCGLGGWLRDLPFAVIRCTDYRDRANRGEGRIGFLCGE